MKRLLAGLLLVGTSGCDSILFPPVDGGSIPRRQTDSINAVPRSGSDASNELENLGVRFEQGKHGTVDETLKRRLHRHTFDKSPVDVSRISYLSPTYILEAGGVTGLFVMGVGVILGIIGLLLVATTRSRSTLIGYGAVAIVPVLIGLLGTWMNFEAMQSVLSAVNSTVKPEVLEEGYRSAWVTTYLGLAFGALITSISCVGFAVRTWTKPVPQ